MNTKQELKKHVDSILNMNKNDLIIPQLIIDFV